MKKVLLLALSLTLSLTTLEVNAWWFEPSADSRELKQRLYFAMRESKHDFVLKTIDDGKIDVNDPIEDKSGQGLLHLAVRYKDPFMVEQLLNRGATRLNGITRGYSDFTEPIDCLCYAGTYSLKHYDEVTSRIVELLYNSPAYPNGFASDKTYDVLSKAAQCDQVKTMQTLLKKALGDKAYLENDSYSGVSVLNTVDKVISLFGRMPSILDEAATYNRKGVVKVLVEAGASLDVKNKKHRTPAEQAYASGNYFLVAYLAAASLDPKNDYGQKLVDKAYQSGNYSLGAYLGAANLAQKYLANKQAEQAQGYASMDLLD
jgi:ankyrin repeat protein